MTEGRVLCPALYERGRCRAYGMTVEAAEVSRQAIYEALGFARYARIRAGQLSGGTLAKLNLGLALPGLRDGRPCRQLDSYIVNRVDPERARQLCRLWPFAGRWDVDPDGGDPALGTDGLIDSGHEADNEHPSLCELLGHTDNSCRVGFGQRAPGKADHAVSDAVDGVDRVFEQFRLLWLDSGGCADRSQAARPSSAAA